MSETETEHARLTEAQFFHRDVDVGEVRLHVVEAGAGRGRPLVVLLHGFPEFWWSWRHQIRALADAGFHVVAPDMRGYNLSQKPADVGAYGIEHLIGDVRGLIQACGESKAVVVGHDWGGGVAWQFAEHFPSMVHRLIILNCPHATLMLKGLRKPEQMKKSWYMFFFQLPFFPERMLAKDDFAFIRRTFKKDGFSKDEIDRYVEAFSREGVARAAINYYRAMMRAAFRGKVPAPKTIETPTLVIWGEGDTYLGREMATPPAEHVPNARVEFIPKATHWVQRDAPERVSELIVEFIADLKTGTKPS